MVNGGSMWKKILLEDGQKEVLRARHYYSRTRSNVCPPPPATEKQVIRVSNNIAYLGPPKSGPKPRQLLSLPPFPGGYPLAGRRAAVTTTRGHVNAISWLKYYFEDIPPSVIQSHFDKGLVQVSCRRSVGLSNSRKELAMREINRYEVMEKGARIYVPVTVAEAKINKRYDVIPSGTEHPNADEIKYLRRLVMHKDSAILVLNKPPKLPVKGIVPIRNSMDALAAAALTYDYNEGPKLVHRLDTESSGILLMGRTKESISYLQHLFSDIKEDIPMSKAWNSACEAMYQRYWALVIGSPKEREGLISAPLTKVMLDNGKTDRVVLATDSGFEASQEAVTEYRVLGPMINGCSWIELCPRTRRKHQLRVHCAEALGTPILGDYKYGWFVHNRWKQMPRVTYEPTTGEQYKLRRPEADGLKVQKGSVLSRVPLLHLHSRELVLPNIEKFIELHKNGHENLSSRPEHGSKLDLLRLFAPMPIHMKVSWKLMSSYLE